MASRLIRNQLPSRVAGSTPVSSATKFDAVKTESAQTCAAICPVDSGQKRDKFSSANAEDQPAAKMKPIIAADRIVVLRGKVVLIFNSDLKIEIDLLHEFDRLLDRQIEVVAGANTIV